MPNPWITPTPVTNPVDRLGGPGTGLTFQGGAVVYRPPESDLVEGRLRRLQTANNPLVQHAREQAMRAANARGDINSSYVGGSATRAAFDAMLPVAQQDSETLTRVNMANMQNIQNSAEFERSLQELQAGQLSQGYQIGLDREMRQRQLDQDLQMQRERLAFEGEQAGYGREHDIRMGNLGYGWDIGRLNAGLEADLARGEQDIWGRRQILGDEYDYDLGRGNQQFANQRDLAAQQFDYDVRRSDLGYQQQLNLGRASAYRDWIMSASQNPDMFGNPEALEGMTQYFFGGVPGTYSYEMFRGLFGG